MHLQYAYIHTYIHACMLLTALRILDLTSAQDRDASMKHVHEDRPMESPLRRDGQQMPSAKGREAGGDRG